MESRERDDIYIDTAMFSLRNYLSFLISEYDKWFRHMIDMISEYKKCFRHIVVLMIDIHFLIHIILLLFFLYVH